MNFHFEKLSWIWFHVLLTRPTENERYPSPQHTIFSIRHKLLQKFAMLSWLSRKELAFFLSSPLFKVKTKLQALFDFWAEIQESNKIYANFSTLITIFTTGMLDTLIRIQSEFLVECKIFISIAESSRHIKQYFQFSCFPWLSKRNRRSFLKV